MDKPAVAPAAPIAVRPAGPPGDIDFPTAAPRRRYPRAVRAWLLAGLVLIFVQVVVGGITRLTGSGLSITRWEIVTGTLPPLGPAAWEEAFDLYRATPQYAKINEGMRLADFKFIYFWEYFHRLWARLMGLVFVVPLGYFLAEGYIDRRLGKRLALVFAAAALTASFGWIMVASGLIERPLVNAYKLSIHLGIAFVTFGILLWTVLCAFDARLSAKPAAGVRQLVYLLLGVLVVQILLGGMMSGMKAALAYPTWPDLNGALVPGVLFEPSNWTFAHLVHYDSHPFMSALVQVAHRTAGYAVAAIVLLLVWRARREGRAGAGPVHTTNSEDVDTLAATPQARPSEHSTSRPAASELANAWSHSPRWRRAIYLTGGLTLAQVVLGIITVALSDGTIPVSWGVLHQAGALLLLSVVLYDLWLVRAEPGVG